MRHPPPPQFEPAVTVTALALNNLTHLPYTRLRLSSTPSATSPVATRAKWLEHGVGSHTAFHAAALAELAESVPAALAVSVPHPSTSPSPPKPPRRPSSTTSAPPAPSLWLFAPHPVLRRAKDLLLPDFALVDPGVWTPASLPHVTRALTLALRRAIASAMQPERALRVGDDILHPQARLAYTFNIALGHGPNPHIQIRVAARHLHVRHVDEDDSAAALLPQQPALPVFTAPLGLHGTLAPRPCAGDALSASVLNRWREAGLLPPDMTDSTVIFLNLEDGIVVPFPRAFVLTSEKKGGPMPPKPTVEDPEITDITAKKTWKTYSALWGSRKRPRSPIDTSADEDDQLDLLPPKPQPVVQPVLLEVEDKITDDAPTAHSINAALLSAQANGDVDPVAQLHHPLIERIPPPSFHDAPEPPESDASASDQLATPSAPGNSRTTPFAASDLPPSQDAASKLGTSTPGQSSFNLLGMNLRPETPRPDNSSNGLDAFLMGGSEPQGSSGGFDMTDFGAFDDDVAELFNDNMDDRLQGVDNALLSTDDDPGRIGVASSSDGIVKRAPSRSDLLAAGASSGKPAMDERMDVDSTAQPAADGSDKQEAGRSTSHSATDGTGAASVIKSALSALRRPLPSSRTGAETVRKQLTSFYEQDHMQRRSASLKASRTIGKRRQGPTAQSQRVLVTRSIIKASAAPYSQFGRAVSEVAELPEPTLSVAEQKFGMRLRSLYIPQRLMRKFSALRRKGVSFNAASLRKGFESDSSPDNSDTEEDLNPRVRAPKARPRMAKSAMAAKPSNSSSALHIPDAKVRVASRSDANNKPGLCLEYDPAKIVDSVAVDCASVCMVLAAERASYGSSITSGENSTTSMSGGDANGSPTTMRETDVRTVLPSVPQNGSRGVSTGVLPKSQVSGIAGSQSGRISKKERELLSMISLLEMQMFGRNELQLFNPVERANNSPVTSDRAAVDERSVGNGQSEKISPSAMRRLLLGLTRALEMSDTFKTWTQSFRESEKNGPVPCIQGPLSVNAFLGESASVFPLSPARVCVGYGNELIETNGGTLPMWEKAGIEPYSAPKNVEYVALAPKDLEEDVKVFLRDVTAAYKECSYGKHTAAPFESVSLVANSMAKGTQVGKAHNGSMLSDSDKAMAEQYHLSTTTLCTKLAAVARDKRKNPSGSPTNIVVYVVSPFEKDMSAANVALLQAVAPLVGSVPGTVPALSGHSSVGLNLPAAPWRCSPVSKSVVSITVRIIPREVVDRRLTGQIELQYLLKRPLRPQLIKAVCFAVYSSIRYKRVRTPASDAEVGSVLARGSMVPDDLMSPMTPEVMGDGVGGPCGTPVSPIGVCGDDVGGYNVSAGGNINGHVDQSWALSASYLYEGAVALAGVGKHIGETGRPANLVFHVAYAFCESTWRYVFSWTDQRGEMLDTGSVPVSRSCFSASRRKAFWGMWARGQRWRLPFVSEVHVTVCKLGAMTSDELEDWDWVVNKTVCGQASASNHGERKASGVNEIRVVRRFPAIQEGRGGGCAGGGSGVASGSGGAGGGGGNGGSGSGDDIVDVYTDIPTPATPGMGQSGNNASGVGGGGSGGGNGGGGSAPGSASGTGKNGQMSMDIKLPNTSSVSILNVCEADTDVLLEKPTESDELDRRDFGVVSDMSLCKGMKAQANILLGRYLDDRIGAIEIGVLRHYGCAVEDEGDEKMSDERSRWDWFDVGSIANTIGLNFHELRYVSSPPSWPAKRWVGMYPIHLEAVRTIAQNLRFVNMFGGGGGGGTTGNAGGGAGGLGGLSALGSGGASSSGIGSGIGGSALGGVGGGGGAPPSSAVR